MESALFDIYSLVESYQKIYSFAGYEISTSHEKISMNIILSAKYGFLKAPSNHEQPPSLQRVYVIDFIDRT